MKHAHTLPYLLRRIAVMAAAWLACLMGGQALAQSVAPTALVVIVNAKTPTPALTNKEVADLYLGRTRVLPNGQRIDPLDHPAAAAVRARFYKALTGKAITDINAYWARLLFTGQSSPPQAMPDAAALIEAVRTTPGAMAYVEQGQVPNAEALGLKVVLTIPAP